MIPRMARIRLVRGSSTENYQGILPPLVVESEETFLRTSFCPYSTKNQFSKTTQNGSFDFNKMTFL